MKSLLGANQNCIPRNDIKFDENYRSQNPQPEILNINIKQRQQQNDKDEEEQKKNLREIFKVRKLKSMEGIRFQQEKINQWLIEDKEYLKLKISISDSLEEFVSGDLELEESENQIELNQIQNWDKIEIKDQKNQNNKLNENELQAQNIILKNKIIRLQENKLNLRCLSVQCEINILMSGESNFYIFSRCTENFNNQTVVCYISKELESARKFISFAILEENNNKFIIKNLKKQEIPRQENYIKALDISEIKFIFVDNGDNKCYVFLDEQEQNSNLILIGDFYVPITQKSNIMFGVSGDLISLKKLIIKQTVRNSYMSLRNSGKNNTNVPACNCCNIF